jgi:hypothetical protein
LRDDAESGNFVRTFRHLYSTPEIAFEKCMGTHRETSGAILIDSFGRLLFQQRDDKPQVSYPGMIGLFGGNREGNETWPRRCISMNASLWRKESRLS